MWTGVGIAARDDWIYTLNGDEVSALDDIAKQVRAVTGDDVVGLLDLVPTDIDLGVFGTPMADVFHQMEDGRQLEDRQLPAVHNMMLLRHPDLVAELTADMFWTKHGEVSPGEDPWRRLAVFNYLDGYLATAGGYKHIEKAMLCPEQPL